MPSSDKYSAQNVAQHSNKSHVYQVSPSQASNPLYSAWVAASAGTGKTKLLTDRILRLLLAGTLVKGILCITYTKAGAYEMHDRVIKRLKKWANADDEALALDLSELLEIEDNSPDILSYMQTARTLFSDVSKESDGLRIQTIHSLCQSIISRFTLEAGVEPGFTVLDETSAREIFKSSFTEIIRETFTATSKFDTEVEFPKKSNELQESIEIVTQQTDELSLLKLLSRVCARQEHVQHMQNTELYRKNLLESLEIQDLEEFILTMDLDEYFAQLLRINTDRGSMLRAAECMQAGTKTDIASAQVIARMLQTDNPSVEVALAYKAIFLTQKLEPRKNIATKGILKKFPDVQVILELEQQRILELQDKYQAAKTAKASLALATITFRLVSEYQKQKRLLNTLDYNDLLLKTISLLEESEFAAWVLYRLDGGLEHVLVDEAQDTSPLQWRIIQSITGDFFAGESAFSTTENIERTIFAVGDIKQSIFSFQGAEPKWLHLMRSHYQQSAEFSGKNFANVPLAVSYRSAPPVLQLVDAVLEQPALATSISPNEAVQPHNPHRTEAVGIVEIHPEEVLESEKLGVEIPLTPQDDENSANLKLAIQVAQKVKNLLSGEILESRARPIKPDDIMILFRTRSPLINQIIAQLRAFNIPVSGLDKLTLKDSLLVRDIISAFNFIALPQDDLNLACLLKSRFFNVDEESLLTLTQHQQGSHQDSNPCSLWQALQNFAAQNPDDCPEFHDIYNKLSALLDAFESGAYNTPAGILSVLIHLSGGRGEILARNSELQAEEAELLDELFGQIYLYESAHTPSIQGFLSWFNLNASEIKRDMDNAQGVVRIITVHSSKGLQAPIVIMPDTAGKPKYNVDVIWADYQGIPTLYWVRNKTDCPAQLAEYHQQLSDEIHNEYLRLMYVALTRAEDRLYIFTKPLVAEKVAEKSSTKAQTNYEEGDGPENSARQNWYFYIQNAAQKASPSVFGNHEVVYREVIA